MTTTTFPTDAPTTSSALRPWDQVCRVCGALTPAAPQAICEHCLGPLEPQAPPSRRTPDRATIARRAPTLWRYAEWLPFAGAPELSLDTGFTPLLEAPWLAERL